MVNTSRAKRNLIWWYTLSTAISGALGAVTLHSVLSGHYSGGYPLVPIYFYFFRLFSTYAFDACHRHTPQRMSLLYLATKMIETILSLIPILAYCLTTHGEVRAFLLTSILFYLMYLVSEIWFFFSFELNQKRKKKSKRENGAVA